MKLKFRRFARETRNAAKKTENLALGVHQSLSTWHAIMKMHA